MDTQLKTFTRHVIGLLVKREYLEIERLGWIPRESAVDLEKFINQYGATLIELPIGDDSDIEARRSDREEAIYFIIVNLHSQEEGRTDLSLVLTVIDGGEGTFKVTNFDVDVL